MKIADGCTYESVHIHGQDYERVKVGAQGDFLEGAEPWARCEDCNALVGHYHHTGCDNERCPVCGRQLITCEILGCDDLPDCDCFGAP